MKKTYLVEETCSKTYELEGTELEIQDEIERIMSSSEEVERDPDYYEYTAKEIGTFIWEIVGEGNDHDETLKEIESMLGEDYLLSEEMTEFYIEHWDEYECAMDIDSYAYLNTLFGYDIGSDNARQISNWLYEKFNMTTEEIPDGDDADNLMRVAKWDLGLNLDFSNFNAHIEAIRYDW